jgi:glycosyltransferase involved in cell wall biosynthesis
VGAGRHNYSRMRRPHPGTTNTMRSLFALPGIHRVNRGAEVALENVAVQLASLADQVTVVGSGPARDGAPYDYRHVRCLSRERFTNWRSWAPFHHEFMYEDATFAPGLTRLMGRLDVDVTLTCNYPYTSWALRSHRPGRSRPAHVFVTQNGDWPAVGDDFPSRWFRCEGLVCTNPVYFARNQDRWRCALIPNGVDVHRFGPGPSARERFDLPADQPVVLMVSALRHGKFVDRGIKSVAELADAFLVVAGSGPQHDEFATLAEELLPGRHRFVTLPAPEMPDLYRSADAFLHMTPNESFGNVYIEALRSATPVVAHADPVTEWILEDAAHLVDTASVTDTAAALDAAIRADRARLVQVAETVPDRFSWEAVGRAYHEFLTDVVKDATT